MDLSILDAETRVAELLVVAQIEPVRIFKDNKPYAVLFSSTEYAALMTCKMRLLQLELELEKLRSRCADTDQPLQPACKTDTS